MHDGEEFNTVAAGEDVGVHVTFRNPLQVKLALSRVRLHVHFTPADKAAPGAGAPAAVSPAEAGGSGSGEAAVSAEDVLVMESQFSLHPGEEEGLAGWPLYHAALCCAGVVCGQGSDSESFHCLPCCTVYTGMPAGSRRGRVCCVLPATACVLLAAHVVSSWLGSVRPAG